MTTINTPKPEVATTEQPKEITPLRMEAVNGVRSRVKSILKKWGALTLAGGILGGTAGGVAQSKYRDWTGYDPNKDTTEEVGDEEQGQETEEQKEATSLLERAREKMRKAKESVVDKISQTEIVQDYNESVSELRDKYTTIKKVGDKLSFWLPFLLMFLATVYLGNKAIKIKKSLTQRADPVIDKNMKAMEKKINELIKVVNDMSKQKFVSAEEMIRMQEKIDKLYKQFEALNPDVVKEISEKGEATTEPKKDIAA